MLLMAKTYPYGSKGVLRNYHYLLVPKLGPVIVSIIIIPWSWHYCTTQLYLPWDSIIKDAYNQPKYGYFIIVSTP